MPKSVRITLDIALLPVWVTLALLELLGTLAADIGDGLAALLGYRKEGL